MPQLAKFSSFAILLLFLSIVSWVAAHSPAWPTIAYSETVQLLRHDILQRKHHSLSEQRREQVLSKRSSNTLIVQRGDLVRVQLSVFNKTFFLHLEPNFDLIHPALASSGQEDLGSLDDIKPFKGVVLLDSELSKLRWDRALTTTRAGTPTVEHMLYEDGVVGWARMMIEQDDTE
ncbi:hypothetical protein BGZ99_006255 [Dissophora globulifera]|uniref:Uncharacterized protein n=1 Tax=Dissophora globulifera TaxID=979702 RepID=A0A9P6RV02_9FUNG|nr:hypothetical protein BGZ99_006255 [Dissophora globulifera]